MVDRNECMYHNSGNYCCIRANCKIGRDKCHTIAFCGYGRSRCHVKKSSDVCTIFIKKEG